MRVDVSKPDHSASVLCHDSYGARTAVAGPDLLCKLLDVCVFARLANCFELFAMCSAASLRILRYLAKLAMDCAQTFAKPCHATARRATYKTHFTLRRLNPPPMGKGIPSDSHPGGGAQYRHPPGPHLHPHGDGVHTGAMDVGPDLPWESIGTLPIVIQFQG